MTPLLRVDCHTHTTHSDGTFTTDALLALAKEKGLDGLSITDHDTLDAYPRALELNKQLGLTLISGIEISTEHQGASVHVLGYAFDLNDTALNAFCTQLQHAREQRNEKILERLKALNKALTLEEIKADHPYGTIGRPHIARLMVKKGYAKSMKHAFSRYLGDKASCYVKGFHVPVEQAIELIHQANGFAVLAHPQCIRPEGVLPQLLTMPFDGIEAHYARLLPHHEKKWVDIAKKKNWLITGGSDFHGDAKAHPLGCSWCPPETLSIFKARFAQTNPAHS